MSSNSNNKAGGGGGSTTGTTAQPRSGLVIPKHVQTKGKIDRSNALEKWNELKIAIGQIYEENASSLSFQTLYTNAYHIVLHKHGEMLYTNVIHTISDYIKGVRDKLLLVHDSIFLKELLRHWEKHRKSILMIRDILMYMDKNYVAQNKKPPIYEAGVRIFGSDALLRNPHVLERMQRLILELVRKERDGEATLDRFLVKSLTMMMTEIGKRDVYDNCFEKIYEIESIEYYKAEARDLFDRSTVPDYLRKVQDRLREERERADRCFDESTKVKIESAIKTHMILSYVDGIINKESTGVLSMFQQWQIQELRLVYDVLDLVDTGLDKAIEMMQQFLTSQGLELVNNADKNEHPLDLIEECIQLRTKFDHMLDVSFSKVQNGVVVKDRNFQSAVRRAFEDITNTNDRFPEYLSLYVDSKLKKGKNLVQDFEYDLLFEQVIALFRHLREKDVFEKYYKSHLAKRLLSERSASDEAERNFIAMLKSEFGYQFTSKLEGMFKDMKLSKDIMVNYKLYLERTQTKLPMDISVQALTSGFWPVTTAAQCEFDKTIRDTADNFKKFYLTNHSGRRLTWQYNMGTADIRVYGFAKHYELNVATYQMCILLLFNNAETITFGDILSQTQIPIMDLKRNVASLCTKAKTHEPILKREGSGKDFDKNTAFTLNREFSSKLIKVKINPVILKESSEQKSETMSKINEDRKWQIDAILVRIMKARKTEEHRNLVMEATKQLQARFMPSPELIKKRIESLIEREYLERSPESRSRYNYLA